VIKNFVYLDEDKMYSLSSQIFEGITEYVLSESHIESDKSEEQKGPVGSGRIIGDVLKQSDRKSEMKFLSDYSYTLFEKKLLSDSKVIELDGVDDEPKEFLEEEKTFIKVKAKATFNDINATNLTLENFNEIGKALTYITNFEKISEVRKQLRKAKTNVKDRNKRAQLQSQAKSLTNVDKLAKESGLQQDQTFLENLAFVLKYGFQDQFEVQMRLSEFIFSANLKRSCLRENENLIVRKYSRQTEVDFFLFGMVTQCGRNTVEDLKEQDNLDTIKEALMNLVDHLTNVESSFTGRLSNEIIIDPIALYTEI